jgi:hypothetical protein
VLPLQDLETPLLFELVVAVLEVVGVEVGFGEAEAADEPLVVDDGVDEVPLTRGDGVELGIVFVAEAGEGFGLFRADDQGFGMKAGFEGVESGNGLTGVRARAGRVLRIQTIRGDLFLGCHK